MSFAELEPPLRFSITSFQQGIDRVNRLPRSDYDSALDDFRYHAHEAIHALQLWAKANGIEVRESMPT